MANPSSKLKKILTGATLFSLVMVSLVQSASADIPQRGPGMDNLNNYILNGPVSLNTYRFTYADVNPKTFDPTASTNNNAVIRFSLDSNSNVKLVIRDQSGAIVRTIYGDTNLLSVTGGIYYNVSWDGRSDYTGQLVPSATYYYNLEARNPSTNVATDQRTGPIIVNYSGTTNPTSPLYVSNVQASPLTINPNYNEKSTILYSLNQAAANVQVILTNGSTNVVLTGPTASGSNSVLWNGMQSSSGSAVPVGYYTYVVKAVDFNGAVVTTAGPSAIYVSSSSNGGGTCTSANLTNLYSNPSTFNPANNEVANLYFTIDRTANISVKINDQNGNLVKTLYSTSSPYYVSGNGTYKVQWDGRGDYNYNNASTVNNGNYTYQVTATTTTSTTCTSNTMSGTVTVSGSGYNDGTVPNITNFTISPNPFDPDDQLTQINYSIDRTAEVTLEVLDYNNNIIRTLLSNVSQSSGSHSVTWNGQATYGTTYLSDGNYTVRLRTKAINGSAYDTEVRTVTIDRNGYNDNNNGTTPNITNFSISPNPFDPDDRNTQIAYTIDRSAEVTVQIIDTNNNNNYYYGSTNNIVRTLLDTVDQSSGTHYVTWDGRSTNNSNFVNDGSYTVRIKAKSLNASSYDTEDRTVTVDRDGTGSNNTGNFISNLRVNPSNFNPNTDSNAVVYYNLSGDAIITVEIYNQAGNRIRTLVDHVRRSGSLNNSQSYGYSFNDNWNGRDSNGNVVPNGTYKVRVSATSVNGNLSDSETANVNVNGSSNGSYNNGDNCGGFTDVYSNSTYCKAIQMMKDKGIFQGYSDNTFRPYQQINRAETAKVIAAAFNISTNNNYSSLNFSDTDNNAWYSPWVNTLQRLGILRGYPDNTFRPNQTVNRVELLKIFMETAGLPVSYCNQSPYSDTPLNSSTRWYMDYVCSNKYQYSGLMHDDGNGRFNPATPMTRGDVADLFYQYEIKGLSSQANTTIYNTNTFSY